MLDKLLRLLFFISFLLLFYFGGAVSFYLNIPPVSFVANAIQGGKMWVDQYLYKPEDHEDTKSPVTNGKPRVAWNKNKAFNGYTLLYGRAVKGVELVDMKGTVVHKWFLQPGKLWPSPSNIKVPREPQAQIRNAHVYPDGSLIAVFHWEWLTPYGAGIVKVDKDSNVIWKYAEHAHHDLYIDHSNGEIYGVIHEIAKKAPKGYEDLPFPSLMDYVIRLSPDGRELQRVSVFDALTTSGYVPALYYEKDKGGEKWDLFHTNSVMKLEPEIADKFPMFKAGQVLLSLREPDLLAVLDMSKKKVVWAMKGYWHMQHAARFLDDGTIMLFDNKGHRTIKGQSSRILIIEPTTGKTVWYYATNTQKGFNSPYSGSVQKLDNGNILISSSLQQDIFEVTPQHEIVWDYERLPHSKNYLLAYRYRSDEVPFVGSK